MAAQRAAVRAFNEDVLTPAAFTESAYRTRTWRSRSKTPSTTFRVVERAHRPTIMVALPFMVDRRSRALLSALAKHLADSGFRIVIVTTVDLDPQFGDSSPWFEDATSEIYQLPRLMRREYWADFLDYVVDAKKVDIILVAGSEFTYHQLPELRQRHPGLRIADLLFNTQGHVENNSRFSDQIDLHLCENLEVRDWLMAHGQDEESILMVIESGVDISDTDRWRVAGVRVTRRV